jgi:hypothetical protein
MANFGRMAGNIRRKLVSKGNKSSSHHVIKELYCGRDYVKKLWDRRTDNSEMFLLEVLIKN